MAYLLVDPPSILIISSPRRRWPRVRQRRGAGGQQRRFAHAERRRAAGAGLVPRRTMGLNRHGHI